MTDRYAVIGHPIAHSKSPAIHAAFARETGEDLVYDRILAPLDDFAGTVRRFIAAGGRGLNVTIPFKEAAWALSDERAPRAQVAGAVNTLSLLPDGRLRGDNTDGVGLVRDLATNNGFAFAGTRILLLGAGGAARGLLQPLLEADPTELVIANRTAAKAHALAALISDGRVSGCGLDELDRTAFDLIINATSAGLDDQAPPLPNQVLAAGGWVYDLVYRDDPTPFQHWGLERGAAVALDGLGMLVEQAAESFFLWRGRRPHTAPVIAALRSGGLR
ncbi:shikimate dehydrogenase [Thioalkalicoccus limnaeus]|uniref:Shikimate dehydrogenase (NADP(+)) n=1 Tax=Thioalkalicoccus limnaeus TaxID=120681 RepID=A0ABV4B9Y2_9GAMM